MTDNKIDLSCIAGTDVLCYFWDDDIYVNPHAKGAGLLKSIEDTPYGIFYLERRRQIRWDYCYIAEGVWIANPGGKLVLPDGLEVELAFPTGHRLKKASLNPEMLQHDPDGPMLNVIAVKVIGPAPGWSY